ncbi:MAG TPA: DUF402 domain-containing protein [Acidimicrobiales bacterium]
MPWRAGDLILQREVLRGGRPWLVVPVRVVDDRDDLLVTYLAEGARFGFPPGEWPTADGRHPWQRQAAWHGHGTLMLQRPGEAYAVWHFWTGPERTFSHWYVNLQQPFRRTSRGVDTQDHELDIVVTPDGSWTFKDWDLVDQRVAEGRFTPGEASDIRTLGERVAAEIAAGTQWWDDAWVAWQPDPAWRDPALPDGWDQPYD